MIVRTLDEARASSRRIVSKTWESTRLLLKGDGMGFSFHITTIYAGTETPMWYKNHLESVYCVSGEGQLLDRETGKTYDIGPGTLYVLDKHDQHTVIAKTDLVMACVFNPPLNGREVHDETGAYPLEAEAVA